MGEPRHQRPRGALVGHLGWAGPGGVSNFGPDSVSSFRRKVVSNFWQKLYALSAESVGHFPGRRVGFVLKFNTKLMAYPFLGTQK